MEEQKNLKKRLLQLEEQHAELDKRAENSSLLNAFELQGIKRKKLQLKDQISQLRSLLYEDIIA